MTAFPRWKYVKREVEYVVTEWVVIPMKIIVRNKKALVGLIIVLGYIIMATIGPEVVPYPRSYQYPKYIKPTIFRWPPSLEHPLGTDYFGADIWAKIVWGSRPVLTITFITGLITTTIGVVIGLTAGFLGGLVDMVLMGITDILMTIPGLPLLIVLATLIRASDPVTIGLILSITAWTGLARSIRSAVLSLKNAEFVEAAKALGMPFWHIIFREIMPNLMSFITVNFIFAAIGAIYGSIGLYFLGILPFTEFNWGVMLNMAYAQAGAHASLDTIHYILAPIGAIIGLQLGLLLLSYAVDEIFNPRLRTEVK